MKFNRDVFNLENRFLIYVNKNNEYMIYDDVLFSSTTTEFCSLKEALNSILEPIPPDVSWLFRWSFDEIENSDAKLVYEFDDINEFLEEYPETII